MTTVREDLVAALEATIVGRHIIGCHHDKRRGSTSERYGCLPACALATAALDRARAEPEYVCCDDHASCPCYTEGLEAQREPAGGGTV